MNTFWPFVCGLLLAAFVISLVTLIKARKRLRELGEEYSKLKSHPCLSIDFMGPLVRTFIRKRYRAKIDSVANGRQAAVEKYNVPMHYISFRDPYPFSLFEDFDNSITPYLLPDGVCVAADGLPILGVDYGNNIYGKYTVFVADGDSVFHEYAHCINGKPAIPVNIMSVIRTGTLCPKCQHHIPDLPSSPPAWYRNFAVLSHDLEIDWSEGHKDG